jgi:hypothetical protein
MRIVQHGAAIDQVPVATGEDFIAGVLNRNGHLTGRGNRWTRERVTMPNTA